jgi:hypothetical protein
MAAYAMVIHTGSDQVGWQVSGVITGSEEAKAVLDENKIIVQPVVDIVVDIFRYVVDLTFLLLCSDVYIRGQASKAKATQAVEKIKQAKEVENHEDRVAPKVTAPKAVGCRPKASIEEVEDVDGRPAPKSTVRKPGGRKSGPSVVDANDSKKENMLPKSAGVDAEGDEEDEEENGGEDSEKGPKGMSRRQAAAARSIMKGSKDGNLNELRSRATCILMSQLGMSLFLLFSGIQTYLYLVDIQLTSGLSLLLDRIFLGRIS